ncbi:MAG: type II secretion system F family protein [Candidatus Saccharibacteria bacterium]|nr:type II secretion system F family protein [Candidatus Saccharibacteria bacterium]
MLYTYTAISKDNKRITGDIDASDEESARQALERKGLHPLVVKPKKKGWDLNNLHLGKPKIKLKDLVIFTRQLSTMINAGVPLVRSLATLAEQTDNPTLREQINEVTKEVEGGISFADALEKHPDTFSLIYINMVRAGEAGGILDEILKKLAIQQEKDARIRSKFKGAMTYPAILLTITFAVFMGLMLIAMPKIGSIITDLAGEDAQLPQLTQVMLALSGFMVDYWIFIIGGLFVGFVSLRRYIKTEAGRRRKDQFLLKIPVLGTIVVKVSVARFARIFASLMTAGVTVIETLETTSKAVGNAVVEDELNEAIKQVKNGKQLSEPLKDSKIFPPIVSQMMAIGEETGETDQILIKVADFYEEEVDTVVDSLSSILEPIMIVIMGGMVALIAVSVIGPISNLTSQI